MKKEKKGNLIDTWKEHLKGHRNRLKLRFLTQNSDDMDDTRLLELLLTYALPRKDTYPLAAELIVRFGDINGVFSADINELCSIDGIGQNTAILIKIVPTINRKCHLAAKNRKVFKTSESIAENFCKLFFGMTSEKLVLMSFNSKMELLKVDWISEEKPNECFVDMRAIGKISLRHDVAHVALAHNHPSGSLQPSWEDLNLMVKLRDFFQVMSVDFIDMYIIHENNYFEMSKAEQMASAVSPEEEYSYLFRTVDLQNSDTPTGTAMDFEKSAGPEE